MNTENEELKRRLELSSERLNSQTDETDKLMKALNVRTDALQQELNDVRRALEMCVQIIRMQSVTMRNNILCSHFAVRSRKKLKLC